MNFLLILLVMMLALFVLGVLILTLAFCRSAGQADRMLEDLNPSRAYDYQVEDDKASLIRQPGDCAKERPHVALQNN